MAEQIPQKPQKQIPEKAESTEALVRILGTDIPVSRNIYTALTRIKGVSWALSKAICIKLKLDRSRKLADFSKEELKHIENFLNAPELPKFLLNRRADLETGKDLHLHTTTLDMTRDFDIKRLRRIKSYRGVRHALGQPVRGQKTRSHFRRKGIAVGIKKKVQAK